MQNLLQLEDKTVDRQTLANLIDELTKFGKGVDRDYKLQEDTFGKWRIEHQKEVETDKRRLGKKDLPVARVW